MNDLLETQPDGLKKSENAKTPATDDLYSRGRGRLLSDSHRKLCHSMVMKGSFIVKRSHPDIFLATAVLSGKVKEPTESD